MTPAAAAMPIIRHLAGARRPPHEAYDVDVVILALDRIEETCAAIDSARAQRGVTRHILVLDQGSHPSALDRLARHVADLPDVTLLAAARNLGVGGGRNRASAVGHGRVIAALDNNAEFATPDTLAQAVAALDADTTIGVIACRIVTYATGADDFSSWGYPVPRLPQAGACFDAATFVGAGHAIRRTCWDAAGGYDEALFFCWEEYDLALRAIAAGWRIRYRGDIAIRHKVCSERRVSWSEARWSRHVRNRLYIARKCGASWAGLAPRIAAYLLKGLCNRRALQTLRAVAAAASMPIDARTHLSNAARAYLRQTDLAARGSWRERLRNEVLAAIPRETDAKHKTRLPTRSAAPSTRASMTAAS
jgi:GT2 family glycosyltransferase